jgi:glutamyl-tRNA reductase
MSGSLFVAGMSHATAPVHVREQLAFEDEKVREILADLWARELYSEVMILSTCNRVEVYGVAEAPGEARQVAFGRLGAQRGLALRDLEPLLYTKTEDEAVHHAFRVASSLDSMVVGEPQILGQVKEAYAVARGLGAIHSALEALLSRAFAVAKRVRTETAIGSSTVSIASVAVELAEKIFGSLENKTVFLVGAGKMAELAARHLMARGAGKIMISNRTHERAVELAESFDGQAIPFDRLHQFADHADIVLTSTGASEPIFRKEHGEALLRVRKNRPVFFIDIAVPRNVAPEVNKLDGLFVYDVDDLQSIASKNTAERRREAERAEKIIELEVDRFASRMKSLEVVPTILSLQEYCETIRQAEIDRIRGRLGLISPDQEAAIEAMTRAIINKLLHTPITTLKSSAAHPEAATIHEMIRRIFNLTGGKQDH